MLSAGAASYVGLSEAIGAFLAGLLLSETKQRHRISEAIKPFQQFSTAIFFVAFGMSIDYKHIGGMIPVGIFIFIISSFSKVYGVFHWGKYALSKRAGLRLGLSLIPRGEFSIILARRYFYESKLALPHKISYRCLCITQRHYRQHHNERIGLVYKMVHENRRKGTETNLISNERN